MRTEQDKTALVMGLFTDFADGAESAKWQSESQAQFVSYAPKQTSPVDEGDKENCNNQTGDAEQDIDAETTVFAQEDNLTHLSKDSDAEDKEEQTKPNPRGRKTKSKKSCDKKRNGSRGSKPKFSAPKDRSSRSKEKEDDVVAQDTSQLVKPLPPKLTKDISIDMLE